MRNTSMILLCRISATGIFAVRILSTHFSSPQHSLPVLFCILGSPFAAARSLHCAANWLLVWQQTPAEVSYCCFFRTLNDIFGTRVIGIIDGRICIEVAASPGSAFFFSSKRSSFLRTLQPAQKKKYNPVSSVSRFISCSD